jgi:hypothetical protein
MKKKYVLIFSIFLFLIFVFFVLYFYSIKLVPPIFIKGSVVTEKGVVIENFVGNPLGDKMFLKVKKEGGVLSGSEIKVFYSSKNNKCAKNAVDIKTNDFIEVYGLAISDDTISVCGSEQYYIKK